MIGSLVFDSPPDDRANHRDQHNHGTAPHADKSRWGNEMRQVYQARTQPIIIPTGQLKPLFKAEERVK
jgi:hypothetical protein